MNDTPMSELEFDMAIIDADNLFYLIAYKFPSFEKGKKEFDSLINTTMVNTEASAGAIFIKGDGNFRFECDPNYKGNRVSAIPDRMRESVDKLYEWAREFCHSSDNGEADDYCASMAYNAGQEGSSYIVCHVDKDLNTIPGWHYNTKTKEIYYVTDEEAYRFLMQQCLSGDPTDNIKGIPDIGPVKAKRLIEGIPPEYLLGQVLQAWETAIGRDWQAEFTKNVNCIYLRRSTDDIRPLTFEELKERLEWKNVNTNLFKERVVATNEDEDTLDVGGETP